jgi:hypothetical protein
MNPQAFDMGDFGQTLDQRLETSVRQHQRIAATEQHLMDGLIRLQEIPGRFPVVQSTWFGLVGVMASEAVTAMDSAASGDNQ